MFTPVVTEVINGVETRYDIFSRLLKDRIIYIIGALNQENCSIINSQLLFLSHQDPQAPIKIYMDSPGGSITSGMSVYDTMKFIPNPVEVIAIGQCASMAAVLLSGGAKGKRSCLTHSTVLIHQPLLYGAGGQASDIVIQANNIMRWKDILNKILAENTGQDLEKIIRDTDRDFIMNAEEAKAYGIIDNIISRAEKV